MKIRTGLGQDSHRFLPADSSKICVIGGIIFDEVPGFNANSDGDIVFHALCNAITSLTGVVILGGLADDLCLKEGVTDSEVYLKEAVKTLGSQQVTHIAISIEAKKPKLLNRLEEIKENISRIFQVEKSDIGITATTGEGLTSFGLGEGAQCLAIITTMEDQ